MRWLIALFLFLSAPVAAQEELVLGLSQDRVRITTNFDGSDLLIFGAVKREAPIDQPTRRSPYTIVQQFLSN